MADSAMNRSPPSLDEKEEKEIEMADSAMNRNRNRPLSDEEEIEIEMADSVINRNHPPLDKEEDVEMAETAMNRHPREEDKIEILEEEKTERSRKMNNSSSNGGNTLEFMRELNLVLILSFLSLSDEERQDFEEIKQKDVIERPKSKQNVSSLYGYKQEPKVNEFRALERQTRKSQAKIRDCRHCRRM